MISRKDLFTVIAALLFLFFTGDLAWTGDQPTVPTGEIAASVDGKIITRGEVEDIYLKWQKKTEARGQTIPENQVLAIKKQVLEQLIKKELLLAESARQHVSISDGEVKEAIAQIKKGFPNEEAFTQSLARSGIKLENLEKEVRDQRAINQLTEKRVEMELKTTAADAEAFYDKNKHMFEHPKQVRASHILVKVDKEAGPEEDTKAREKIEALLKRLQSGEDFGSVARETSDDSVSASRKGDLGFFRKEQMVPEFSEAAFALPIGQISNVVKTKFGYHVIKVTEIRPAGTTPYDEVKDRIIKHLQSQERRKKINEYVESLQKKAAIQISF